jgi:hypothetical protein
MLAALGWHQACPCHFTHLDIVRPCHVQHLRCVPVVDVQLAVKAVGKASASRPLDAAYKLVHVGVVHLHTTAVRVVGAGVVVCVGGGGGGGVAECKEGGVQGCSQACP